MPVHLALEFHPARARQIQENCFHEISTGRKQRFVESYVDLNLNADILVVQNERFLMYELFQKDLLIQFLLIFSPKIVLRKKAITINRYKPMYNLSVHELMYVGTCVRISVSLSGSLD